ncbi:transcriptional regulator [Verrucomicrobia bacterium LW23]|nr:transcriptional regulator [Verrucomicrobia bacterium LW23]
MTDRELAAEIGVCVRTLVRWRNDGRLPYVRMGGKLVRYKRSDVEVWLEQQKIQGVVR